MPTNRSVTAGPLGCILIIASFAGALQSAAQEPMSPVVVEAPAEAVVGAPIEIRWDGDIGERDFISIDPAAAPESKYSRYIYANRGMPGTLAAPEIPGSYAVRFHSGGRGNPVRGQSPLEVVDTTATFEGPLSADSGEQVEIRWTGPANPRDYVSIDPVGSDDRKYGQYAYTTKNPATLRAPEEPGQYLIRYHLAQSYRVIGQTTLTVGSVTATLKASPQVQAGGEISVHWEGPGGRGDYISIDPPDSPASEYLQYRYTQSGNPALIRIPDEPGRYEIRYHQGQNLTVLAKLPLEVVGNEATVSGPPSVAGGAEFKVAWTGPDNSGDYVTIVAAGSPPRDYLSYHYTKHGSPGSIEAPLVPGAYELRYMTGRTRSVLAQVAIEVTPGAVPGELRVLASSERPTAEKTGAVEVILDASGSMLKRLGDERRIEIAKDALENLARNVIPEGTRFALRVFGHKEADSCRSDLEIPAAALDRAAVSAKIRTIEAMNLAKTPIAASLSKVEQDLAGVSGAVTVVLLTDGEETCDGDPGAAIEKLRKAGFDVRVNIVGFAINELALKEQFVAWARIGNGRYIEAHDKEELREAMNRSLDVPFEVLSGADVKATGVVNGESVLLLPGTYQVRLLGSNPRDLGEVTIEARAKIDLRVDEAK